MVKVIVDGYSYGELDPNEKENADYDLECLVEEVYSYNVDLQKDKFLGNIEQRKANLEKEREEAGKAIAGYFQVMKVDMEQKGMVSSSTIVKLLHSVVERELIDESLEDIKNTTKSFNREEVYKNLRDRFPWEKVASMYCERNGIYFTGNGYALFNGKFDYKINLENFSEVCCNADK